MKIKLRYTPLLFMSAYGLDCTLKNIMLLKVICVLIQDAT